MAQLIIRYGGKGLMARLPRQVRLNGQLVGILQKQEAIINLPAGKYSLSIAFGGPIRLPRTGKLIDLSVSTEEAVSVTDDAAVTLTFSDRERIWNILFDIDLVLWIAEFFFTLPSPWNHIYSILSNAFFVVWLLRILLIHKRYYKFYIT